MVENPISDEVDLLYVPDGHGWSTCLVMIGQTLYHMGPTHIFGSPMEAMLDGFSSLLEGEPSSEFLWHEEPGKIEWHLAKHARQQHIVTVSISSCIALNGTSPGPNQDLVFDVKLEVISTLILHQMQKVRDLMKIPSYAATRDAFPFAAFNRFEQAYKRTSASMK